ncbi:hypothetical protein Tco_0559404 [Tanacetum coccineum]
MLAPKRLTFNGRPTFANPMCFKKAQSEIPCLYDIPYDQSDPANSLIPDREETLTLERESREKLNKDLVKHYDYTKELVDQAWVKHSKDRFCAPTALDIEVIIKTCLMPLSLKTQNDSFAFVHELKQEMHADLKYVESLEKEVDELESDKAEFSNMYDMLLQECVSNDVMHDRLKSRTTQNRAPQLPQTYRSTNPRVSTSIRVTHITNVSRPQTRNTQMKDKVVLNINQVKSKKTEVEDHHRIPSISNQTKSVIACNDSLKSRTSNVNAVCATCGKCVFNSNHDACVYKFLNDMNA